MTQTTLVGLRGAARAWRVAEHVRASRGPTLVVCPEEQDVGVFHDELSFFLGDTATVVRYPADDFRPYDVASPDPDDAAWRVQALWKLHALSIGEATQPLVVLTSARAVRRRTIPRRVLSGHLEYLVAGEEIDRDALLLFLARSGYHRVAIVEDLGTFAVRGGILDIFPPLAERPVRIEFFGDEVESIRPFDIRSQRSKGSLEELVIVPVREVVFSEVHTRSVLEHLAGDALERDGIGREFFYSGIESLLPWFYPSAETIVDYLPKNGTLIRIDPMRAQQTVLQFWETLEAGYQEAIDDGRAAPDPAERYTRELRAPHMIDLAELETADAGQSVQRIRCDATSSLRQEIEAAPHDAMLEPLARRVLDWQKKGTKVVFVVSAPSQGERLLYLLSRYRVHVLMEENPEASQWLADPASTLRLNTEEATILLGDMRTGFHLPEAGLVIIAEQDVFGPRARRRRAKAGANSEAIQSLGDLKIGDLVVHRTYGVGIFKGVRQLDGMAPSRPALEWLEGSGDAPPPPSQEFVHLEYQGGDKVYAPVYRMNLIEKYRGEEGEIRLDKLGGASWETRKKRVVAAVKKMARELLELYARREVARRPSYPLPEDLTKFEAEFAFEETPDQRQAIVDVYNDLDADRPMDRLVCGDVGFGKTEVALRAAFRVAMSGRQVAVLVPTTILAQQHERTFKQRFSNYPIEVGLLSRFVSSSAQKEVLKRLSDGTLDIVIGTHKLLSKDVGFCDLGLFIVDEEHRFGVTHKERLKTIRTLVDVLTLTATPIPRTLHMSMTGMRDMSIIVTPPQDRLPIRTFVNTFENSIVREAIVRELKRGGQVYFVHNRVQTIASMATTVARLVPEARIGIAHGQMSEKDLSQVMIDFLDKKYDVLICTSIIESGLDIPSANTLIVNRADTFGLAQLYQIRGRVGRSFQRAYAYLLVPGVDVITQKALDRLQTLQEFTELGSGFRIAARDMELRGVGNLLGASQHGHINAVGFDYYLHLLQGAIADLKGEVRPPEVEPEINLRIAALIPETYIQDAKARVGYYRRLANAGTDAAIDDVRDELRDRFGVLPEPVENLVGVLRIKNRLQALAIPQLETIRKNIMFTMGSKSLVASERLVELAAAQPRTYTITPKNQLIVTPKPGVGPVECATLTLELLAS